MKEDMALDSVVEIRATDPLMASVYALRHEVFVVEQGIPEELEQDEDDRIATHFATLYGGRVVGTLRTVAHGRVVKVGRMAVASSTPRTNRDWLCLCV